MTTPIASILKSIQRRCQALDPGERAAKAAELAAAQRALEISALRLPETLETMLVTGQDRWGQPLRKTPMLEALLRLVAAKALHVVLSGEPGTGKSVAAAQMLEHYGSGRWVSAVDYCTLADWAEERLPYLRCRLLVVDDLGLEPDRAVSKIEALVYERHAQGRTTVYTTNLTRKQLRGSGSQPGRYDERVLSRWREGLTGNPVIDCSEAMRPRRK